jgi:DNA-binding GntR family transcriptional regulator
VIFAAANRPRLYVQIRSLRQEAERYRSLRHAKPIELRLGLQHHRQMIAACERKNGEEAERLMRIAMERSLGIVRKLLITWRDANRGER